MTQLKEAKDQFKQLLKKGKEIREKELLEYNTMDLPTETTEQQKYRLKVIKRIIKEKRRNQDFKYITKYIGRGDRESLRKLYIKNIKG